MIAWLIVTFVLLLWALIYCAGKVIVELRGPKPASGVWGLFALAGIGSALALFAMGALVSVSGI